MKNPHFGKWPVDDDPADYLNAERNIVGPGSRLTVSDVEMITALESEKARLKGLLNERSLSQGRSFDDFLKDYIAVGDEKFYKDLLFVRAVKKAIREINFKIRVIKGKARV